MIVQGQFSGIIDETGVGKIDAIQDFVGGLYLKASFRIFWEWKRINMLVQSKLDN